MIKKYKIFYFFLLFFYNSYTNRLDYMKKSFRDLSFFFKSSIMISGIFPIAYSVGGFIHKNYYGKKISFYHSSDIHSAACIPFFKFPIHIYCICHNIINIIMHNNCKSQCFFTSKKIKDALI